MNDVSGSDSDELNVAEIFGPTFQGEGPSAGRRCGFVRLGRCNLSCTWCDTPYTWDWERFDPKVETRDLSTAFILEKLDEMHIERVVITGGEPLLQQRRMTTLLKRCKERGFVVEIETNGTIVPSSELLELVDQFNVSPKLANSGVVEDKRLVGQALLAFFQSGKSIFKFVVNDHLELDEVHDVAERFDLGPIWIMPQATTSDELQMRMRSMSDLVIEKGWNLTTRLQVELWGDQRGR